MGEHGRPGPVTAPTVTAPWLVNARTDLFLVFVLGAVWSGAAVASVVLGSGFLLVAALFAVLADFPHVLQTSLRVWLDPAERRRHGAHYLISLAVIGTAVGTLAALGRFIVVVAVFLGWQILHVVKQHIGMVSVYAAKAGYRGSRTLAKRALVFGCLAPVLYRAAHGVRFGDYVVGGRRLPFSGLSVPLPPIPPVFVWAAYAVAAVAVAVFVREQVRRWRAGSPTLPAVALLTIGVAIAFYNGSYLLLSDPYALTLIATTFHSLQYHLISWARNRGAGGDPDEVLVRLSRPRALLALAVVLIVPGVLLSFGEFVLLGVLPFTVVLHHFYLDGVLWKPARNPGLAAALSLRPA
jgi:hypothetical protein